MNHAYTSALCTSPSSHPLLLVEKSYNIPPIRQKMLEICFEEHDVPAVFLARDAVTACYAVGRTTGTVVDVGHVGTVVTPVFEGYVESRGIIKCPYSACGLGMDNVVLEMMDDLYRKKKSEAGVTTNSKSGFMPLYQLRSPNHKKRRDIFHKLARLDIARICREGGEGVGVASFGYTAASGGGNTGAGDNVAHASTSQGAAIATTAAATTSAILNAPKVPYELPDGTLIDIPHASRYDVAELLFGKDDYSCRKREEGTLRMRKKLSAILASATSTGMEQTSSSSNGESKNHATTAVAPSPAAASLSLAKKNQQPNSKRHKTSSSIHSSSSSKKSKREQYHAACIPYLSSQIGELTSSPLPAMVCDAAFKCDRDQQAQLLGNVILCGGGACIGGTTSTGDTLPPDYHYAMTDRLRDEVESIIHTHTPGWRVKVLSPNIPERAICSWLGGSILGSLGTFHDMWITRKEYEEFGPSIVNRKCP
mmetsp:Transcript_26978/g.35864  ORF Transcript_26978/g.35864 Transcript_26978/m.35864 type:complete len:480 (+) Transcript_26978:3-1442(+)